MVSTLVELLRHRAQAQPDRRVYTFLEDGETTESVLTYGELDRRALHIAAGLQRTLARPGDSRVLLLFPAGLDYITAFFGCLYAGAIAVPAYPPRLNRPTPRLQAIAADATPDLVLTTPDIAGSMAPRLNQTPEVADLRWLTLGDVTAGAAPAEWRAPGLGEDALAYLQYTSGSTASPKGVMLSHANLLHNLGLIEARYGLRQHALDGGRGVSWLPMYHDMGLIGIMLETIYAGGDSVLMSPTAFVEKPARWLQAITRHKGTMSAGPNFAYQLCVDKITPEDRASLDLSSWEFALCGAEPIRPDTVEAFARAFEPCGFRREAFHASYGLAEAVLVVATGTPGKPATVRCVERRALADKQVRLLDSSPNGCTGDDAQRVHGCGHVFADERIVFVNPETLRQTGPDEIGEIWISSPSVAEGYWGRPEESQRTFGAHLLDTGEGPFLRTGDLGFMRDGELFVAGRLKDLIIIRGRNYYPPDIEQTAERSHPAIMASGVAAFSIDSEAEERLALAIEIRRASALDLDEVARAVRRAVAEVQELAVQTIVFVKPGRIPRTSSGKTQRYACREEFLAGRLEAIAVNCLDGARPAGPSDAAELLEGAPRTPAEQAVAGMWADALQIPGVGVRDNFFQLGGNSLLATQVVARVRQVFGVELPIRALFDSPTVEEMALQVEDALRDRTGHAHAAMPPLEPVASPVDGQEQPLSYTQERMWVVHQLQPDGAAYNMAVAVRLRGKVNLAAFDQTWATLAQRQGMLRASFSLANGRPVQVLRTDYPDWKLNLVDVSQRPLEERESAAQTLAGDEARRPFDLGREPLARAHLYRLDEEDHLLLITMHHIISDAWSFGVIAREIKAIYTAALQGDASPGSHALALPALPIQYTDFAVWQRQWLKGGVLASHLDYWRQQLAGLPALELPTSRPRPAVQSDRGTFRSMPMPEPLLRSLRDLGNREGATLFMTLLAAFQTLLYRYTGQEDIAVGAPIANRRWLATEGLVGAFVNTLVMRTNLTGTPTFRELLRRVRDTALDAYAHQDMPFEQLVAELRPGRDRGLSPLIQVLFNVTNVPVPALDLPGLKVSPVEIDRRAAQFDLTLFVSDTLVSRTATIEYNTDLFDDDFIARMLEHYAVLLNAVVADPDQSIAQLPLLAEDERSQLLTGWNDTQQDYPSELCLHQLFEAQAARTPDRIALTFGNQSMSYRQLDVRANQLAHYLRKHGVGPETLVGIHVDRSLDMVVGLLGILKAGGAYVPLDPAYPKDRLTFMIEDACLTVIVSQSHLKALLPEHEARVVSLDTDWPTIATESELPVGALVEPGQLAYTLYTSGSTGKPKGVQIEHRAVVNFLHSMGQQPGLTPEDVLLAVTTLSFDIAGLELYLPLSLGARVVILSRDAAADGARLARALATHQATVMQATPVTWRLLIEAGWKGDRRLKVLCGGEALPPDLAEALLDRCGSVWNLYGPTETTIWSTVAKVEQGVPVTVGRPIANTTIYVLDSALQPIPAGVPGDLYIGGAGLARGYLNRPELTAERFVRDPFSQEPGARLYKTGDLARYRSDGTLDYLGRSDFQVKVRGFRIELGEIETALMAHPSVQSAVVVARDDRSGAKQLVAYVIPAPATETVVPAELTAELRDALKKKLPDYMAPAAFVFLEAFPLTPNRKVDRRALPAPDVTRHAGSEHIPPRNALEAKLARQWEELLGVSPIGVTDNFFDLGGHSLLGVQLFAAIEKELGKNLPLTVLFEEPTIEHLAIAIRRHPASFAWPSLVPIQPNGNRDPLFFVHPFAGDVVAFKSWTPYLGDDQPLYGLRAQGLDSVTEPLDKIADMAARYIAEIRTIQPEGPYYLGGYSAGAVIAFEMAQQLAAQGQEVALTALVNRAPPYSCYYKVELNLKFIRNFVSNLGHWLADFAQLDTSEIVDRVGGRLVWVKRALQSRLHPQATGQEPGEIFTTAELASMTAHRYSGKRRGRLEAFFNAFYCALDGYHPQPYPGKVVVFRTRRQPLFCSFDEDLCWRSYADAVEVRVVSGSSTTILREPHARDFATQLRASLEAARAARANGVARHDVAP